MCCIKFFFHNIIQLFKNIILHNIFKIHGIVRCYKLVIHKKNQSRLHKLGTVVASGLCDIILHPVDVSVHCNTPNTVLKIYWSFVFPVVHSMSIRPPRLSSFIEPAHANTVSLEPWRLGRDGTTSERRWHGWYRTRAMRARRRTVSRYLQILRRPLN
jgi:hypothetical protein